MNDIHTIRGHWAQTGARASARCKAPPCAQHTPGSTAASGWVPPDSVELLWSPGPPRPRRSMMPLMMSQALRECLPPAFICSSENHCPWGQPASPLLILSSFFSCYPRKVRVPQALCRLPFENGFGLDDKKSQQYRWHFFHLVIYEDSLLISRTGK